MARAGIDRPHIGGQQPDAALRLVHGRDAELAAAPAIIRRIGAR